MPGDRHGHNSARLSQDRARVNRAPATRAHLVVLNNHAPTTTTHAPANDSLASQTKITAMQPTITPQTIETTRVQPAIVPQKSPVIPVKPTTPPQSVTIPYVTTQLTASLHESPSVPTTNVALDFFGGGVLIADSKKISVPLLMPVMVRS